jgi:hypothetical protein
VDPVWTLFSRRTFSRLAYWLSVLGYDLRDRSVANRIYLVYFWAFWSAWAIAVFALLGSTVAGVFHEIESFSPPPQVVVTLAAYTLIIWALAIFWQVSRRSPFVFSEEDAYLLCQTPVNRRELALVWFLQGIMGASIPFAAGTVILSFALLEWRLQGQLTIFLVAEYLKTSLRALILVMPVQIGWQAALWGLGALRLHGRNDLVWLRRAFLGAVLFFLAGLLFSDLRPLPLAPLSLPLKAAFMEEVSIPGRSGGLGLSLLYLAAGLGFLAVESEKINLSRAAQETGHVAAMGLARAYGQLDLVDAILLQRRLGTTRSPSRLLAPPVGNALFWKDLLQSLRVFRLRECTNLVLIFGLSLGMFRPSNWALQMVMAGVWAIRIGDLTTRRLRSDLARWWLLRSLPLRPEDLLKYELVLSCGIYVLVSWSALAFSNLTIVFGLYAAGLLPILDANAALAAAHDILRHSKARILMSPSLAEENVPRQNIGGMVRGLISVLIPFGILIWSYAYPRQPAWGAAAFPIALLITWLNRRAVLAAYRWIE